MTKNVFVYIHTHKYTMMSIRKYVLKFEKLNFVLLHSVSSPLKELTVLQD